jgi:hypothetical protein
MCMRCGLGKYSEQGSAHCEFCEEGHFSNRTGATGCFTCTSGSFADPTEPKFTHCMNDCPTGKYQMHDGSHKCKFCRSGFFSAFSASSACMPCRKEGPDRVWWTKNKAGEGACFKKPVHCKVGDWAAWGECAESCGVSLRVRTRPIVTEAWGGGLPCSAFAPREEKLCNLPACPLDCLTTPWGPLDACPVTCGGGVRIRKRRVIQMPLNGGKSCPALMFSRPCDIDPCGQLEQPAVV